MFILYKNNSKFTIKINILFNNNSKGKKVIIQGINNPSQVKHNDLLLCDLVKMIDEASKELRKAKRNRTDVLNNEIKIAQTKLDSLRKELSERNKLD